MKYRLLDILICPNCSRRLNLWIFSREENEWELTFETNRCSTYCAYSQIFLTPSLMRRLDCESCYREEVEEGLLSCEHCGSAFPVVRAIPRMLPDAFQEYPDFVVRHQAQLGSIGVQPPTKSLSSDMERVKKTFGYEWLNENRGLTSEAENVLGFFAKTGIDPTLYRDVDWQGYTHRLANEIPYIPDGTFLHGKLVLDAGCGMGRYTNVVNKFDCEVVGFDLSAAVERARRITRSSPFTHILQGDILAPPFRKCAFDHVFSIGVLHHTPNTYESFHALVPLLKTGGTFSLCVYEKSWHSVRDAIEVALRKVTTRLPLNLLYYLAYLGVPLGGLQRQLRKNRLLFLLGAPIFVFKVSEHWDWRVRLADTFDLYHPYYQWRHTKAEVVHWFEKEGFINVRVLPDNPICVAGEREG